MKSLIIYCSSYKNNTEKIARVFSEKMDSELINIKDITDVNIISYNLIGFGSGVYKESLSPKLFELAEKLDLKNKNVFVFSTSGIGMTFYNKKLIKLLMAKGAVNIGSFACKGNFIAREFSNNKLFDYIGRLSQGHPNDRDFKYAERFIERVLDSLEKNSKNK
ncbi:flavodoxin domain-containing protein [Serpentinicella alkaliphila]|uniref:Flavodoxin n=1 Tax=Serpentinicella alkaliphila TaxID=1734049 RepID=A0A4R2T2R9_9FIRM|nr:flavodoxin family protein [Serpentinicella alkaliphila]QUH26189.1 flavodoxin [Serpentinicella alkaliphila]TCP95711.1 flavodoxin [Serpentinicella alkaliphila]